VGKCAIPFVIYINIYIYIYRYKLLTPRAQQQWWCPRQIVEESKREVVSVAAVYYVPRSWR